ncbi:MAG: hypothetical protein IRZ33_10785 [Alicyclobacillaceae bacterium]|nr:hypothetical protein [Alicyclobacillaceae bacterium]
MAVVLLIAVDNLKSAWWMMSLIGAVVGVATGQLAAGAGRKAQQAAGSPASPAASPAPRNQAVAEGDKPLESDGGRE